MVTESHVRELEHFIDRIVMKFAQRVDWSHGPAQAVHGRGDLAADGVGLGCKNVTERSLSGSQSQSECVRIIAQDDSRGSAASTAAGADWT